MVIKISFLTTISMHYQGKTFREERKSSITGQKQCRRYSTEKGSVLKQREGRTSDYIEFPESNFKNNAVHNHCLETESKLPM